MTEQPRRWTVSDRARSATGREWEVFLRSERGEPLCHVGSVTAADDEGAYEHATRLFGSDTRDVWVCPTGSVSRYAAEPIDDRAEPAPVAGGGPDERHEAAGSDAGADGSETRER